MLPRVTDVLPKLYGPLQVFEKKTACIAGESVSKFSSLSESDLSREFDSDLASLGDRGNDQPKMVGAHVCCARRLHNNLHPLVESAAGGTIRRHARM